MQVCTVKLTKFTPTMWILKLASDDR